MLQYTCIFLLICFQQDPVFFSFIFKDDQQTGQKFLFFSVVFSLFIFLSKKCWQILQGTKIRFNVHTYIYNCICVFSCLAKPLYRSYHLCDSISILACFVEKFIVDTPVIRIFHWVLSIKHFCSSLLRCYNSMWSSTLLVREPLCSPEEFRK